MPKTAIFLTLKASKRLRGWLIVSHVVPFCFVFLQSSLVVSSVFFVLALATASHAWVKFGLSTRSSNITTLAFDDHWYLGFGSGVKRKVALLQASSFSRFWLLLVFVDADGKTYRVFICSDSIGMYFDGGDGGSRSTHAEGFRRFRLWFNLLKA
jgi:hypothetical protein